MKASFKSPSLEGNDYYEAAEQRWREVGLYYNKTEKGNGDYWLIITYLAVVSIECLLTAIALKEHSIAGKTEPDLVIDHDLIKIIKLTSFKDPKSANQAVYNNLSQITLTWKHWPKDLRYLSDSSWETRINSRPALRDKTGTPRTREDIGKEVYSAAFYIKREGDRLWSTLTP
jgi:hypothetical protein